LPVPLLPVPLPNRVELGDAIPSFLRGVKDI
jgi:hypothetical protein